MKYNRCFFSHIVLLMDNQGVKERVPATDMNLSQRPAAMLFRKGNYAHQ